MKTKVKLGILCKNTYRDSHFERKIQTSSRALLRFFVIFPISSGIIITSAVYIAV